MQSVGQLDDGSPMTGPSPSLQGHRREQGRSTQEEQDAGGVRGARGHGARG